MNEIYNIKNENIRIKNNNSFFINKPLGNNLDNIKFNSQNNIINSIFTNRGNQFQFNQLSNSKNIKIKINNNDKNIIKINNDNKIETNYNDSGINNNNENKNNIKIHLYNYNFSEPNDKIRFKSSSYIYRLDNIDNKKKKMITKTYINSDEKRFNKYKIINNSQNKFESSIFPNITNNRMNKYINKNYRTKSEFYQSNFEKINRKNNNHNIQHNLFFSINQPDKFKTVSTRQNGFLYLSLGKLKSNKFI